MQEPTSLEATFSDPTLPARKRKISARYFILDYLLQVNDEFVKTYNTKKGIYEKHEAIYLTFNTELASNVFSSPGLQLTERHLTVEKFHRMFSAESSKLAGVSLPHYTEVYTSSSGEEIVIHLYPDPTNDQPIVTQVKKYHGNRHDSSFEFIELNAIQTSLLQNNFNIARTPLQELALKASKERFRSVERANQIDEQLKKIPLSSIKKNPQEFTALANKFVLEIKRVNDLSDTHYDPRGNLMSDIIKQINEDTPESLYEAESSTKPTQESSHIKLSTQEKPVKPRADLQFQEVQKLKSQLDKTNTACLSQKSIDPLLQRDLLREEAWRFLIKISLVQPTFTPKQKNIIIELALQIEKIESLVNIFFQQFWNCSLESLKIIYHKVQHSLTPQLLFDKILTPLIQFGIPVDDETDTRIKLDYLLQVSEAFGFIKKDSPGQFMFSNPSYRISNAPLAEASRNNSFFIYRYLLVNGFRGQFGTVVNDIAFPSLYWTAFYANQHKDSRYVDLLLEAGENFTQKPFPIQGSSPSRNERESNKLPYYPARSEKRVDFPDLPHILSIQSVVQFCIHYHLYYILDHIIPHLELNDLLLALARIPKSSTVIAPLKGEQPHKILVLRTEEGIHSENTILDENPIFTLCCAFIQDETGETLPLLRNLVIALETKFANMSDAALEAHSDDLIKKSRTDAFKIFTLNYTLNEKYAYYLIAFLTINSIRMPTFMVQQKLIRICCTIGSLSKNAPEELKATYHYYYLLAEIIGRRSNNSKELMETPIFKHVLLQLNASPSNKPTQSNKH